MESVFNFPGFRIHTAAEWRDITDSLNDPGAPFTLAKPDGVGALQFSVARYKSGDIPSPSLKTLSSMVREFAENKCLESPFDEETFSDKILYSGVSFDGGDSLVRVWYVSDGKSFLLVTYVCDWESQTLEVQECNDFVKSVRFMPE